MKSKIIRRRGKGLLQYGDRFGYLTVIEQVDSDKRGARQYLCQCDCGNTKVCLARKLREGSVKSCGCYKPVVSNKPDILHQGDKHNYLTVIKQVESNKYGKQQYLCQCDCGNTKIVTGAALRSGRVKSCGCYRKTNEYHFLDDRIEAITSQGAIFFVDLDSEWVLKKGVFRMDSDGYYRTIINHKRVGLHRLLLSDELSKPENKNSIVKYKNKNHNDNRLCNLEIFHV